MSNAGGHTAIPLSLRYNSYLKGGVLLAVADEEGFISIVDTSIAAPRQLLMQASSQGAPPGAPEPLGQWRAHSNAVFGMQWIKVRTALRPQSIARWLQTTHIAGASMCGPRARALSRPLRDLHCSILDAVYSAVQLRAASKYNPALHLRTLLP